MRRGAFAAAVALLTLLPQSADAFCRTVVGCKKGDPCDVGPDCPQGTEIHWGTHTLTYRFSTLAPALLIREEARAAIREAFHRWSDTLCPPNDFRTSLRFVEADDVDAEKPVELANSDQPDERFKFGIYFRDQGWPYNKPDATLAQTNVTSLTKTGLVTYVDMEINSGSHLFAASEEDTEGDDLQAVITHEAGHYIGLAHSKVTNSIMVYDYCGTGAQERCSKGKVAARRLSNDDIAAVCALYPPGEEEHTEEKGCQMTKSPSSPSLPDWGALGLVVSCTVFGIRRLRRGAGSPYP